MKTLKFTQLNNLSQLHDELLAISALRPVPANDPRFPGAKKPVMGVEASGENILLIVPDDVADKEIENIVKSHVPKPRPSLPDLKALMAEIEKAEAEVDKQTTVLTVKEALKVLHQKQRTFLKAQAGLLP
jgi:hypothetical protein